MKVIIPVLLSLAMVLFFLRGRLWAEQQSLDNKAIQVTQEEVLDSGSGIKQIAKGAMLDGKKVGTWTYTVPGSQAYREEQYDEEGRLHGSRGSYWAPSRPHVIEHFKHGKRHGLAAVYHPATGGMLVQQNYSDGVLEGESIEWDVSGKVTKRIVYHNGVAIEGSE